MAFQRKARPLAMDLREYPQTSIIIEQCCEAHDVSFAALMTSNGRRSVVARKAAIVALFANCRQKAAIARFFGLNISTVCVIIKNCDVAYESVDTRAIQDALQGAKKQHAYFSKQANFYASIITSAEAALSKATP